MPYDRHDKMKTESTDLLPVVDETSNPSIPLRQKICQKIISVRWRDVITTAIIAIDFFVLYASLSLIAVFFPAEVHPIE